MDQDRQDHQHLHLTIELPGLLQVAVLVAHILNHGTELTDQQVATLQTNFDKLHKASDKLKAAVAAAPLQTP